MREIHKTKIDGAKLRSLINNKQMTLTESSLKISDSPTLLKNACAKDRQTLDKGYIIAIESKLGIAPEEYVIKDEARAEKQDRILTTADLDVICDIIKEELNKYFNKFDKGEEK